MHGCIMKQRKRTVCLMRALCHIGYNKLNEGFWCDEGCKWFQWIYKYDGGDMAGSNISAFEVDRKPVLKAGGQLHLSQNWHLYLQLKANSVKVKKCSGKRRTEETGKWFDYLYLSHSMIHNAGIGLFAAHELLTRTLIGYYCSVLIWHSSLKLSFNEHVEIELLDELTDAFSILMWDSTREWVTG